MNEETRAATPRWYLGVAIVAVLWNLMGCMAFAMEVFAQEAMMEAMTEAQKEWARSTPGWIYFVYAFAVITGVAGSVGLVLRKGWSVLLLALSLVAVLVQMVYVMLIAGGLDAMGPSGLIMPGVVIFLSAILLWFSRFARGKGWLVN